ncbi:hypothetical protein Q9S36_29490 [Microbacterium sp. ARD31]|jgi:hypothetical protein|uniref:hypothetical protein n=1 Tax=Microbacterium sp. ARD31 TaxID=2962576 RepID=UPI002881A372|nr:hypothetical protein [Microbacterium sp. ARD31]MDT0184335.1 hypothetical protein [Microbacterium sp. ARD31]
MQHLLLTLRPVPDRPRDERGDVPGWVMVTLMTAIVVAALTPFVGDELRGLLERAFSMVSG